MALQGEPGGNGPGLLGNYPNPFGSRTTILFRTEEPGTVKIEVFDLGGRLSATVANGSFPAGEHRAVWTGTGVTGEMLPAGVYECRMTAGTCRSSHKMIIIR
jgi:flagellar hook assembly protein FlgD